MRRCRSFDHLRAITVGLNSRHVAAQKNGAKFCNARGGRFPVIAKTQNLKKPNASSKRGPHPRMPSQFVTFSTTRTGIFFLMGTKIGESGRLVLLIGIFGDLSVKDVWRARLVTL